VAHIWEGVLPAVTTKFHADFSIDRARTGKNIEAQIEAGVDGIRLKRGRRCRKTEATRVASRCLPANTLQAVNLRTGRPPSDQKSILAFRLTVRGSPGAM
jgi:hypothetical protein